MKSSAQVVVIGGGVIGASVLYHLTELGWTDVVLVERKELTAGSTWHAAGGMHTLNGDPNVAKLQQYTVELYRTIEERSGQNCSIHMPGGLMMAGLDTTASVVAPSAFSTAAGTETKPAIRSSRTVEARALARASAARLIASPLLPDVFRPRRVSILTTVV